MSDSDVLFFETLLTFHNSQNLTFFSEITNLSNLIYSLVEFHWDFHNFNFRKKLLKYYLTLTNNLKTFQNLEFKRIGIELQKLISSLKLQKFQLNCIDKSNFQ